MRKQFSDLPQDMQVLLGELVDADWEELSSKGVSFPLLNVDINRFPDVPMSTDYRKPEQYEGMSSQEMPPVVLWGNYWLDGRHRVYEAKRQGMDSIPAIDVSGLQKYNNAGFKPEKYHIAVLGSTHMFQNMIRVRSERNLPRKAAKFYPVGGWEPEDKDVPLCQKEIIKDLERQVREGKLTEDQKVEIANEISQTQTIKDIWAVLYGAGYPYDYIKEILHQAMLNNLMSLNARINFARKAVAISRKAYITQRVMSVVGPLVYELSIRSGDAHDMIMQAADQLGIDREKVESRWNQSPLDESADATFEHVAWLLTGEGKPTAKKYPIQSMPSRSKNAVLFDDVQWDTDGEALILRDGKAVDKINVAKLIALDSRYEGKYDYITWEGNVATLHKRGGADIVVDGNDLLEEYLAEGTPWFVYRKVAVLNQAAIRKRSIRGHECDACGWPLNDDDYVGTSSWSYTCPHCGFKYVHGMEPLHDQLESQGYDYFINREAARVVKESVRTAANVLVPPTVGEWVVLINGDYPFTQMHPSGDPQRDIEFELPEGSVLRVTDVNMPDDFEVEGVGPDGYPVYRLIVDMADWGEYVTKANPSQAAEGMRKLKEAEAQEVAEEETYGLTGRHGSRRYEKLAATRKELAEEVEDPWEGKLNPDDWKKLAVDMDAGGGWSIDLYYSPSRKVVLEIKQHPDLVGKARVAELDVVSEFDPEEYPKSKEIIDNLHMIDHTLFASKSKTAAEPTKEMENWFKERTAKHIKLVQKYCNMFEDYDPSRFKGLVERGKVHDDSKLKSPEREPYVYVTWDYHEKDHGRKADFPEDVKKKMNEATEHHVHSNPHHPEYHSDQKEAINREDRDGNPSKPVDATKMSDLDIAEMVADWAAMSEEKRQGSPRGWADKKVGKRWNFKDDQKALIYELIDVVEGKSKKTAGVEFDEDKQKWFGWSHRGKAGFGVGDVVKKGDVIEDESEGDKFFKDGKGFKVGFKAETLDDAKKMAELYAERLSSKRVVSFNPDVEHSEMQREFARQEYETKEREKFEEEFVEAVARKIGKDTSYVYGWMNEYFERYLDTNEWPHSREEDTYTKMVNELAAWITSGIPADLAQEMLGYGMEPEDAKGWAAKGYNNITKEQFQKIYEWYGGNPKDLPEGLTPEQVLEKIKNEEGTTGSRKKAGVDDFYDASGKPKYDYMGISERMPIHYQKAKEFFAAGDWFNAGQHARKYLSFASEGYGKPDEIKEMESIRDESMEKEAIKKAGVLYIPADTKTLNQWCEFYKCEPHQIKAALYINVIMGAAPGERVTIKKDPTKSGTVDSIDPTTGKVRVRMDNGELIDHGFEELEKVAAGGEDYSEFIHKIRHPDQFEIGQTVNWTGDEGQEYSGKVFDTTDKSLLGVELPDGAKVRVGREVVVKSIIKGDKTMEHKASEPKLVKKPPIGKGMEQMRKDTKGDNLMDKFEEASERKGKESSGSHIFDGKALSTIKASFRKISDRVRLRRRADAELKELWDDYKAAAESGDKAGVRRVWNRLSGLMPTNDHPAHRAELQELHDDLLYAMGHPKALNKEDILNRLEGLIPIHGSKNVLSAAGPKTIAQDMLERADSMEPEEYLKFVEYALSAPGMDSVTLGLSQLDDIYHEIYQAWNKKDVEGVKAGFKKYLEAAPEGRYEQLLEKAELATASKKTAIIYTGELVEIPAGRYDLYKYYIDDTFPEDYSSDYIGEVEIKPGHVGLTGAVVDDNDIEVQLHPMEEGESGSLHIVVDRDILIPIKRKEAKKTAAKETVDNFRTASKKTADRHSDYFTAEDPLGSLGTSKKAGLIQGDPVKVKRLDGSTVDGEVIYFIPNTNEAVVRLRDERIKVKIGEAEALPPWTVTEVQANLKQKRTAADGMVFGDLPGPTSKVVEDIFKGKELGTADDVNIFDGRPKGADTPEVPFTGDKIKKSVPGATDDLFKGEELGKGGAPGIKFGNRKDILKVVNKVKAGLRFPPAYLVVDGDDISGYGVVAYNASGQGWHTGFKFDKPEEALAFGLMLGEELGIPVKTGEEWTKMRQSQGSKFSEIVDRARKIAETDKGIEFGDLPGDKALTDSEKIFKGQSLNKATLENIFEGKPMGSAGNEKLFGDLSVKKAARVVEGRLNEFKEFVIAGLKDDHELMVYDAVVAAENYQDLHQVLTASGYNPVELAQEFYKKNGVEQVSDDELAQLF